MTGPVVHTLPVPLLPASLVQMIPWIITPGTILGDSPATLFTVPSRLTYPSLQSCVNNAIVDSGWVGEVVLVNLTGDIQHVTLYDTTLSILEQDIPPALSLSLSLGRSFPVAGLFRGKATNPDAVTIYCSGALLVSSTDPVGDYIIESSDGEIIYDGSSGEILTG